MITAIVGGLLVSRINGSFVTINGPAAGLIVVVLASVQDLGAGDAMAGYRYTLAAIVCASVLQTAMGLCRAGKLSAFFPSSAVHGMLAAIGIIIMSKQLHVMLGVKPDADTLFQTIAAIPASLRDMNPEVATIGGVGLLILIGWTLVTNRYVKMIPAPLVVVIVGMALGQYFDLDDEHIFLFLPDTAYLPHHEFTIGPKFLVAIPNNFLASFAFPDFTPIFSLVFWQQVFAICLVGSLETLLSAAAVDKLDPYKRTSDLNRDLAAVGLGNIVCGLIGGLPMIAEIVRSSANCTNGARTGWANFFHGAFLLLFVALFPKLIHEIPLASLAALLVFTGFRLASPSVFKKRSPSAGTSSASSASPSSACWRRTSSSASPSASSRNWSSTSIAASTGARSCACVSKSRRRSRKSFTCGSGARPSSPMFWRSRRIWRCFRAARPWFSTFPRPRRSTIRSWSSSTTIARTMSAPAARPNFTASTITPRNPAIRSRRGNARRRKSPACRGAGEALAPASLVHILRSLSRPGLGQGVLALAGRPVGFDINKSLYLYCLLWPPLL
ncbi:SulP family inorganic anion transporter [Methylocystis sp. IM2]|uniref:SulP family inorganic anion transporter n=1 Tax=Methylocystis sp. IM2 TaxID=3136563 RepID=UPI0030F6D9BC